MPKKAVKDGPPLADVAYRRVRDAILQGRLAPGAPLSRRRLAEDLGMSSVPVGEALMRLETEGVVESRPRAGTRVKVPTQAEIRGQYVVREALETHSARLFAENATPFQRRCLQSMGKNLDAAYQALNSAAKAESRVRVERMHFELHMFITKAAGCKELLTAIERSRVLLSNWLFSLSTDTPRLPATWHADLAHSLCTRSAEDAAEAMRTHVQFRLDEVVEAFGRLSRQAATERTRVVRGPQRKTLAKMGGKRNSAVAAG